MLRPTQKSARTMAAAVLARVWHDEAFASAALDAELSQGDIADARDIGLATELVYGVLRTSTALEERIATLAPRKSWLKNPMLRAHMLMGAYSLCFLDRVPAFAAVNAATEGARAAEGERAAGFVNAVLRKLAAELEQKGRPSQSDAIVASAPGWLRGALRRALGRAGAAAYLAAGPVPPPIGLCLRVGEDRDAWIERLRRARLNAEIEAGKVSPHAILVRGAGDVRKLEGAGEAWIVQEEGAQVVALAAGVKPGERVLDACAGRGNKTWLLGQEVGSEGQADASDLFASKIEALRNGPPGRFVKNTFVIDWTTDEIAAPEGFYDRVIVDAPCTGTGTLRRRPEIGLKRSAEDPARMGELQVAITRRAATRVREGGSLLYAVCSVLREEGEEVIERLCKEGGEGGPTLEPAPFESEIARAIAGEAHWMRLLPHVHGTDGYFVASLRVKR